MKIKELKKTSYAAPEVRVIGVHAEGILCVSGTSPWYMNGGTGDFNYSVEVDDTWV